MFVSWVDGRFAGSGNRFLPNGPRRFARVATLAGTPDPLAPPRVAGVVAEVTADGSVSVLWDPVSWSPPPSLKFTGYEVALAESAPEGARSLPVLRSVGAGASITDAFVAAGEG